MSDCWLRKLFSWSPTTSLSSNNSRILLSSIFLGCSLFFFSNYMTSLSCLSLAIYFFASLYFGVSSLIYRAIFSQI